MTPLRVFRCIAAYLALELIALLGAIGYVVLGNTLPEPVHQLLAAMILLFLVGAIVWRFVRVMKDPVGSVTWKRRD
jgi:hypothetical protein